MTHSSSSLNTTTPLGPATRVPITFTSEGHTLAGILYKPIGDSSFPTIVVLHGASAGKQDTPLYLHLAQAMNEIGVAVYIYDRRGEDLPWKERVHPGYMALGRDGNDDVEIHRVPRTGHSMVIDEPAYIDDGDMGERKFSPVYTRLMQDFVRRVAVR